jgi:hypothetical protein
MELPVVKNENRSYTVLVLEQALPTHTHLLLGTKPVLHQSCTVSAWRRPSVVNFMPQLSSGSAIVFEA